MKTHTTKQLRAALLVLALGSAGAACSAEKIGQSIAENAIENACEDEGTNCNVDLDGDSIKFETDEGTMTVDEDGNAVIVDADGNVVNVQGGPDGDMTVTDGNGSVLVEQDGDTMTISGDDGDATITTSGDVPAEFPAAIELPGNATVAGSTVFGDPATAGGMVMLNLIVPGSLGDVAAAAAAGVTAGGYTQVSKTETPDGHFYVYEGNGQSLSLAVAADSASGGQMVAYSVSAQG